jgi:hypothetical protein
MLLLPGPEKLMLPPDSTGIGDRFALVADPGVRLVVDSPTVPLIFVSGRGTFGRKLARVGGVQPR